MRAASILKCGVAATLIAAPGFCAEPEPNVSVSARASAEALFEEGVRLSEQNQLEEACKKFEASEALDVAVGTLLRLADCRERTGRYASAWARFREAGSLAQTQGMTERARIAAVRSAALEYKLARVVLQVPPSPPTGYTVKLSDVTVPSASWGSALPLDPGTVRVEATAPGHVPYRRYVAIPAEEGARVKVALPPLEPEPPPRVRNIVVRSAPPEAPAPPPRPPAADPNRGYAARVIGLSLAATGGVGLAAGGVLGVIASRREDDDSERLTTYAATSAAVGGGLLVAGLVVYFTAPTGPSEERVALRVAPDGQGGFSLAAAGTF